LHETNLFFITFSAALLGVIPPGLVNMSVAKTCVNLGKKAGIIKAVGASTVVFFQALLAIIIAKEIIKNPNYKHNLLLVGIFVLSVMMIYFLIAAITNKSKTINSPHYKSSSQFLKGVLISALNVFPIPYFVVISTLFTPENHIDFSWRIKLIFSISAALGSFTTFLVYVYFFDKIIKQNKTFKQYSNFFMAALMLCLLLITIFRVYG
jgi:threonine/homoserine/homoserine lactone efflux protein